MADPQSAEERKSQVAANQPYDEAIEVGDEEEVASVASPHPPQRQGRSRGDTPPDAKMSDANTDDEFGGGGGQPGEAQQPGYGGDYDEGLDDDDLSDQGAQGGPPGGGGGQPPKTYGGDEETSEEDSDDSDEDEEGGPVEGKKKKKKARPIAIPTGATETPKQPPAAPAKKAATPAAPAKKAATPAAGPPPPPSAAPLAPPPGAAAAPPPGPPQASRAPAPVAPSGDPAAGQSDAPGGEETQRAYDPADYDHLTVTPEVKELFQYITRYTPQTVELDYKLKPFIPDYIPCVGDIDAFLKIPRPDNKPDTLGLTVLDEPCAKQSDPTVLDLQLRQVSKQTNLKQMVVKSIQEADKNPKQIDNWIQSISNLHKSKPPPNVHYTKNMPDFDKLMQEWPPEFEELLKEVDLPTADLDCDLVTYIEIICSLLDIPIYKSKIQSLHVLFTLFSEFKNSQHFRSLASQNKIDNVSGGAMGAAPDSEDRLVL